MSPLVDPDSGAMGADEAGRAGTRHDLPEHPDRHRAADRQHECPVDVVHADDSVPESSTRHAK